MKEKKEYSINCYGEFLGVYKSAENLQRRLFNFINKRVRLLQYLPVGASVDTAQKSDLVRDIFCCGG